MRAASSAPTTGKTSPASATKGSKAPVSGKATEAQQQQTPTPVASIAEALLRPLEAMLASAAELANESAEAPAAERRSTADASQRGFPNVSRNVSEPTGGSAAARRVSEHVATGGTVIEETG